VEVFISWSGPRSKALAEALREWLPQIMNAIRPWLSTADMEKGTRWASELAAKLQTAKAGIICVTPGNMHADWLLFEAGALSKSVQSTYVCPLLLELQHAEVEGPLSQFQATTTEQTDVLKLVKTLNSALVEPLSDSHIERSFAKWWPELEEALQKLPSESGAVSPHRDQREMITEILDLIRVQGRSGWGMFFDDNDKGVVLVRRAWNAVRAIHGAVGGSTSGPVRNGFNLDLTMQVSFVGHVRVYKISVPADAAPNEMEAFALSQIKETDEKLPKSLPTVPATIAGSVRQIS
jgi:hypothetical protein